MKTIKELEAEMKKLPLKKRYAWLKAHFTVKTLKDVLGLIDEIDKYNRRYNCKECNASTCDNPEHEKWSIPVLEELKARIEG